MSNAASLRERRLARGMTQRDLAASSGVPQPNVSAYESGRRVPSAETLSRLHSALRPSVTEQLRIVRADLLAASEARGLSAVRVFGSVARGEASRTSDLDLLVHPAADSSIFDLAGFRADAERLVGVPVDVVSDRGSGPTMDRIRGEAIPL